MSETHVISALRLKRAELSGQIQELEKRIARRRVDLANLDATIRLFSPDIDPDAIAPKRPYRRTRYFARNELPRLVSDALRTTGGPLSTGELAEVIMRAKKIPLEDAAFKALTTGRVLTVLRSLRKNVVKTGTTRDSKWTLAPGL